MTEPRRLPALLLHVLRGLVYAVPLVALVLGGEGPFPAALYPYVVWKHFAFRTLVVLMTGLWVVPAMLDPRWRPRRSPLLVAAVALGAVAALADLRGVDVQRSVFGTYERMEGLVGLLHLLAFFAVAGTVLDEERHWKRFFHVSLAVCTVVCADALRQCATQQFLQPVPALAMGTTYTRVDARLASPVFLAIYLVLHLFVAALYGVRAAAPWQRAGYGAFALLAGTVLWLTQTRVAYAALLAGLLAALALAALRHPQAGVRRRAALAAGGLGVAGTAALALLLLQPAWLHELPLPRRLLGGQIGHAWTQRFAMWGIGGAGFAEHPLLGHGHERFGDVFDRHFHPSFYGAETQTWWDRPHNVVLQWLVAGGLAGLAAYAALWIAALCVLWRARTPLAPAERCLATGALTAYLAFRLAQPGDLMSDVLLFALLAWLHARATGPVERASSAPARPHLAAAAMLATAAGVALAFWLGTARFVGPARALDRARTQPVEYAADGAPQLAFARVWPARVPSPFEIRELIARQALQLQGSPLARQSAAFARAELAREVDADGAVLTVRALYRMGELLAGTGDPAGAIPYLERARALAPRRPHVVLALATAQLARGDAATAARLYRDALALAPASLDLHVACAAGAIRSGDTALEAELLAWLRPRREGAVWRLHQSVIDAMLDRGRYAEAIGVLEPIAAFLKKSAAAGRQPSRWTRARFLALSEAYRRTGRTGQAVEAMRDLVRLDPTFTEQGLARIRALQRNG